MMLVSQLKQAALNNPLSLSPTDLNRYGSFLSRNRREFYRHHYFPGAIYAYDTYCRMSLGFTTTIPMQELILNSHSYVAFRNCHLELHHMHHSYYVEGVRVDLKYVEFPLKLPQPSEVHSMQQRFLVRKFIKHLLRYHLSLLSNLRTSEDEGTDNHVFGVLPFDVESFYKISVIPSFSLDITNNLLSVRVLTMIEDILILSLYDPPTLYDSITVYLQPNHINTLYSTKSYSEVKDSHFLKMHSMSELEFYVFRYYIITLVNLHYELFWPDLYPKFFQRSSHLLP